MNRDGSKTRRATAVGEDDMLTRLVEGPLHTVFGTFQEILYDDGHRESIALVIGQVEEGQETNRVIILLAHV